MTHDAREDFERWGGAAAWSSGNGADAHADADVARRAAPRAVVDVDRDHRPRPGAGLEALRRRDRVGHRARTPPAPARRRPGRADRRAHVGRRPDLRPRLPPASRAGVEPRGDAGPGRPDRAATLRPLAPAVGGRALRGRGRRGGVRPQDPPRAGRPARHRAAAVDAPVGQAGAHRAQAGRRRRGRPGRRRPGRPRGLRPAHRRRDPARGGARDRAHPRPRRDPAAGGRRLDPALRRVRPPAADPGRAALARAVAAHRAGCGRSSPSTRRSSSCARSPGRAAARSTTPRSRWCSAGSAATTSDAAAPVREIPVGVRVSLDRADDLGNRFAGAIISGPLAIEDPVDRVAAVRGEVLSLHTERALEVLDAPRRCSTGCRPSSAPPRCAPPPSPTPSCSRCPARRASATWRVPRCRGCTSSARCPAPR